MLNSLLANPLFLESAPSKTLRSKPLGLVDVGARSGFYEVIKPLAGATAALAFEPDEAECNRLRTAMASHSPWVKCAIESIALAAQEGESPFFILSSPVNNSLRMPNSQFIDRYKMVGFNHVATRMVRTSSLDKLLFGPYISDDSLGEFLKIDTQGTTFEVLEGAERTLRERTVAICAEVEFFEMYRGQKLFPEIELFLRKRGFSFYGFDIHFRSRKLLDKRKSATRERAFFAEAIFFKDPLLGGDSAALLSERGCHTLFVCALLLGYYDFALELALETWARDEGADCMRTLVSQEASFLASRAHEDAMALIQRIQANPELANLEVGRFVDRRRCLADYDDVP